jgi:hypothetical protein
MCFVIAVDVCASFESFMRSVLVWFSHSVLTPFVWFLHSLCLCSVFCSHSRCIWAFRMTLTLTLCACVLYVSQTTRISVYVFRTILTLKMYYVFLWFWHSRCIYDFHMILTLTVYLCVSHNFHTHTLFRRLWRNPNMRTGEDIDDFSTCFAWYVTYQRRADGWVCSLLYTWIHYEYLSDFAMIYCFN